MGLSPPRSPHTNGTAGAATGCWKLQHSFSPPLSPPIPSGCFPAVGQCAGTAAASLPSLTVTKRRRQDTQCHPRGWWVPQKSQGGLERPSRLFFWGVAPAASSPPGLKALGSHQSLHPGEAQRGQGDTWEHRVTLPQVSVTHAPPCPPPSPHNGPKTSQNIHFQQQNTPEPLRGR